MKRAPDLPIGEPTGPRMGSVVAATALLIGWAVVATYAALNRIDQLARGNAPAAAEQLVWLTRIVAFAFNLGVLVLGAWVLWSGHRICRAGQFPPPGMTLIRSFRTCTGRKARVLGWIAQFVGLVVLVLGTTATWLFVQLAQMLLRS